MSETKSSSNSWMTVLEWIAAILVAVVIAVVIRTFLFAPYEVHGASMEPTLDGEELLIVNKWIYRVSTPEYGDIVVFHTAEERDFIKRVIGLPGDRIEIKDGKVYRNGIALNEPYINGPMNEGTNYKPTTVPANSLYVMGDNRNNSKDSRMIGPVSLKEIVGRADVVVLPVKRMRLLPGDPVSTADPKAPATTSLAH
ncbi:signal peptidase I [Laceyella sacchari]|jgi:signal peptidase I|uniref:Signal peptidase I n=1 Tax=Laceyella sacchari TaxID=37482 RepID=A0ABY5U636_LACSH|nr:signal peptidase I [Laceyella sacchari]KPC77514.1 signal peptidase I [Thermoactinomyces vulgaris]TCW36567.1 signal peptidase I [Laceyella sacchari]UWE03752.1 signal peptidase I [Laceyella sacchari]